jgi:hypothetical protein
MQEMKKPARIIFCVIGTLSIVTGLFGLWYNGVTLTAALFGALKDKSAVTAMPYFTVVFYSMSLICVVCYLLLVFFGFQFVRGRYANTPNFVGLLIFEVVFFFLIGLLWLMPNVGSSIAGASGVSSGGMMAQFIILFPLWAAPLTLWAAKQQRQNPIKSAKEA